MTAVRLHIRKHRRGVDLAHWYTGSALVASRGARVWREDADGNIEWRVRLPLAPVDVASPCRLARRLGRIDQCIVAPYGQRWLAIRNSRVFLLDDDGAVTPIARMRQCRIPLQVLVDGSDVRFGEYGSNPSRNPVPVWRGGEVVFEIPRRARHVHGVFDDPFAGRLWIATGDLDGESWIVSTDREFRDVTFVGDGSQRYRAVTMFFFEDRVVWLTDSQFEQNHVMTLDRRDGRVEQGMPIPSPAWFGKTLSDGWLLAGCAWEHGPGCTRDGATLLVSRDGAAWTEIAFWKKDRWPAPWLRNGVIRFAGGAQTSRDFVVCGEGLTGLDGVLLRCSLEEGELQS